MGLEAINFEFFADVSFAESARCFTLVQKTGENTFVYKRDHEFWIDLELINERSLSIRITLCNPVDSVLEGLDKLLTFLFTSFDGQLHILGTQEYFDKNDIMTKIKIAEIYAKKRELFRSIYGNIIAAAGSKEFYQILREKNKFH